LIECINADGTRAWQTVYKKQQEEKSTEETCHWDSFVYGLYNDQLILLWNNIDLNRQIIPAVIGVPAWYEADEKVLHKKHLEFGPKAVYATFMEVITPTGEHK